MLGLSNDAWVALGAVGGTIGTFGVPAMGWIMKLAKDKHKAEMATQAAENANKLAAISNECANAARNSERDLNTVTSSVKAAWVILDDLRFNAVRKQDQDKLRDEFRADIDKLGTRLEAAIKALSDDLHRNKGGV